MTAEPKRIVRNEWQCTAPGCRHAWKLPRSEHPVECPACKGDGFYLSKRGRVAAGSGSGFGVG